MFSFIKEAGEKLFGTGEAKAAQAAVAAAPTPENIAAMSQAAGDAIATYVRAMKLDVEGHEVAALRGLGERLRPETVDVIQFEYGGAALDAGTTLRDLYRLLEGRGYALAKLFPRALELRDYRPWAEHFSYANYVALAPRWRG